MISSVTVTAENGGTAPGSLKAKATVKYGAKLTYDDDTTEMITPLASFASSTPATATFNGNTLTGVAAGTTNVTAKYGGLTSKPVTVTVTA